MLTGISIANYPVTRRQMPEEQKPMERFILQFTEWGY